MVATGRAIALRTTGGGGGAGALRLRGGRARDVNRAGIDVPRLPGLLTDRCFGRRRDGSVADNVLGYLKQRDVLAEQEFHHTLVHAGLDVREVVGDAPIFSRADVTLVPALLTMSTTRSAATTPKVCTP